MVDREEIILGQCLHAVSDSLGVPAGTFARVDSVGTIWTGEFCFTVRWLNLNPGTKARPISDRNLSLFDEELAHFETVHEADIPARADYRSRAHILWALGRGRRWKEVV